MIILTREAQQHKNKLIEPFKLTHRLLGTVTVDNMLYVLNLP